MQDLTMLSGLKINNLPLPSALRKSPLSGVRQRKQTKNMGTLKSIPHILKRTSWSLTLILVFSLMLAGSARAQPIEITLDANKTGRTFEGIGAVSAGASSRLLIDYPEPQRSQILDYLFKPGYGAALQHLKVEIGGGVNSTDGSEPTHMRTPTDENYSRGYEWWLMKEAKKRNPNIILDCLAWGAPGWIGRGNYYSQDMADYVVKFIKGAKKVHGLDIDYTGIANERYYDGAWIKLLRKTLDASGLNHVGIVVADQAEPNMIEFSTPPTDPTVWAIAEEMNRDPALKAAAAAIGGHYPFRHRDTISAAALASGLPLWSSEDGPWSGDWMAMSSVNRLPLQASYNRNYILCKITKTEVWSPITSYYDSLPVPGSGLMRANTPWSGHYDVQPAIWATAHTTQFTSPGWKYLEGGACAMLPKGGSIVTLKSAQNGDYSIIIETSGATVPQTIGFQLTKGLSTVALRIWQTTKSRQFVQIGQVAPVNGKFSFTFDPDAIYTLTTTKGQSKGKATSPTSAPFPLPFKDDFESYGNNVTPKYFSDQSGTFETANRADGRGKALRQVELQSGIRWMPESEPFTLIGDDTWTDYEVSSDVMLETQGFVYVYGRDGYRLAVNNDPGVWELRNESGILAKGSLTFAPKIWHQLRLAMQGSRISGYVDGTQVCNIEDFSHRTGMAGLGCGVHGAQFDNFWVRPMHNGPRGLEIAATASASSSWSSSYTPNSASDGKATTRWNSAKGTTGGEWLQLTFPAPVSFDRVALSQFEDRITAYKIQCWSGGAWKDVVSATSKLGLNATPSFPMVTSNMVRLFVVSANATPSISEFQVFNQSGAPPAIRINEWMANNATTLRDPADGRYAPWFELYNAGATTVDLSGYYLSGSAVTPFQFHIPSGYSLPAGGALLVWADGQPAQNKSKKANLHVNFTLSAGATLSLLTPQGSQVDAVKLTASGANVAQGSQIDGDQTYVPLASPTPGKSNRRPSVAAKRGISLKRSVEVGD